MKEEEVDGTGAPIQWPATKAKYWESLKWPRDTWESTFTSHPMASRPPSPSVLQWQFCVSLCFFMTHVLCIYSLVLTMSISAQGVNNGGGGGGGGTDYIDLMWLPFFFFFFFLFDDVDDKKVPPSVSVDNQIVGVPLGSDVTVGCVVEASPKSINVWFKDGNNNQLYLFFP